MKSNRFSYPALISRLCGVLLAGSLMVPVRISAAVRDSRVEPLPSALTKQPWGSGELAAEKDATDPVVLELKEPGSTAFHIISGEIQLSAPGDALMLPGLAVAFKQNSKTKASSLEILAGSGKLSKRAAMDVVKDAPAVWLSFTVRRTGDSLVATLGDIVVRHQVPLAAPADRPLTGTLQKGARIRNVTVTTLPPNLALVDLDPCMPPSNAAPLEVKAPALDSAALPPGLVTVDGIPFLIGEQPVDVRLAMAGADFSRRLKHGYISRPAGPNRPVGTVPGKSYQALHVLAFSRTIPNHVPRMTLNYGRCIGWAGIMEEDVIPVPDVMAGGESPYVQSRVPVKLADGKSGWLYHLRIPVPRVATSWFVGNTQFEFTREKKDLHNLPDPNDFARVPVGLPSSVVVVSATAEKAPVGFSYVLGEPGNVFHETQEPVLTISLTNRLDGAFKGRIYARSAGPGTPEELGIQRSEWTVEQNVTLKKGEGRNFPIKVMPGKQKKRGWFEVEIGVENDGVPVQIYRTTYAVLAPDTRKAMADSPFGVWEFWTPHASYKQVDRHMQDAASLINKGGWRWTYGGSAQGLTAEELFDRYKITYTIRGLHQSYQRGEGWWNAAEFEEKTAPGLRENSGKPKKGMDPVYKILHESRSSTTILRRFSEFFGGDLYAMPDKEKEKLDKQFANVVQYCAAIKKADPHTKICLINDYPAVGIEYMKRGIPKDVFDYFGTEGANFMREPERQPDWLCLLGLLHTWKRAQAEYGYQDKPIWTTEALYHGTSPANLSLHAQAVIQAREALLALANGVERMCAAGLMRDCTDDYRWSNWGMGGFCFREPEMNPKPNYAMYAWLTQILDQAKYAGKIIPGSTSLHVLDFVKPDGTHVYPFWCVRGRQEVTLNVKGGKPIVYDAYGNQVPVEVSGDRIVLAASDTPFYVTGTTVESVAERKPMEVTAPAGTPLVVFDKAGVVAAVATTNRILESNWDYPRIKGDYAVEFVQEDGAGAVKIELRDDADPRKLIQRYVELALAKPVVIKDRIEAFMARVKGNGGWGRIMFEIVDAEGRVWTSCGNQYPGACNASDNRGSSYISFDGWQTMTISPPGRLPATDLTAYRSSTCEWWPENTPERRKDLEKFEQAKVDYEKAKAEFPAVQKAHEKAMAAHAQAQEEFKQAKAAYDKEQAEYKTARAAYVKQLAGYNRAKAAYDKAVKAGKPDAVAPEALPEPAAPKRTAPVAPGAAPKAPVEPKAPGEPRDYGIADLAYPAKLTKIIVAASPSILYVDDEVPVANRAIFIDRIGVQYETDNGALAAEK